MQEKNDKKEGKYGYFAPITFPLSILVGVASVSLGVTIGYFIPERDLSIENRIEKNITEQNRPYIAQVQKVNEDSIPDLVVYSRSGKKSVLIGQKNGTFLTIDDVIKSKKDSLKSTEKQLKELTK